MTLSDQLSALATSPWCWWLRGTLIQLADAAWCLERDCAGMAKQLDELVEAERQRERAVAAHAASYEFAENGRPVLLVMQGGRS